MLRLRFEVRGWVQVRGILDAAPTTLRTLSPGPLVVTPGVARSRTGERPEGGNYPPPKKIAKKIQKRNPTSSLKRQEAELIK